MVAASQEHLWWEPRVIAAVADLTPDEILDLIWYLLWVHRFRRQYLARLVEADDHEQNSALR